MKSINRPELIKGHNLNLVRRALYLEREATRQQLSALTGISNVTMGGLLSQLTESGEALCSGTIQPVSGRPAQVYRYNAERKYGLLVYARRVEGEVQLLAELVDLYGDTVWTESRPATGLSEEDTAAYFQHLLSVREPVASVGIGLPGIGFGEYFRTDREKQVLSLSAVERLQKSTSVPIQTENDVNLAAVGYAQLHGMSPDGTLVYLYLMRNSYFGSAIYLNGGLHLGKDRFAGEAPPPPYGADWSKAASLPRDALQEQLFAAALPYLTVLAPHQLVIASDYLTHKDLDALAHRTEEVLGSRHCPEFLLSDSFPADYREGLKNLVLSKIDPVTGTE